MPTGYLEIRAWTPATGSPARAPDLTRGAAIGFAVVAVGFAVGAGAGHWND